LKLYEITIRPLSGFGTPLKGDTLFGHFCWQAAYDAALVNGGLEKALAVYDKKPFAVFSSAFPKVKKGGAKYVLPRPHLPLSWLFPGQEMSRKEQYKKQKDLKAKKWMYLTEGLLLELPRTDFLDEARVATDALSTGVADQARMIENRGHGGFITRFSHTHNSINRLTQTTGGGNFAPFVMESTYYRPDIELAFFVLLDEEMTDIQRVVSGLNSVGRFGFGRDASTGMGRFVVCESNEGQIERPENASACYTLAPCVPEKASFQHMYFSPFIRFGKHGDRLATGGNPFKNPVVMADEGAVLIPKDTAVFEKRYVGTAVSGVSKADPGTRVQGYAPFLPFRLEI